MLTRLLDRCLGIALGGIDFINANFHPFKKFDRELDTVDHDPLLDKAKKAAADIEDNWRFGPEREFYWSMSPNDAGDMAIWQGFAAAAYTFKLDEEGMDWALKGMEKLQYLGGNSRLARGADGVHPDDPSKPADMSYDSSRKYYYDNGYIFHDDCSESSLIGHLFGCWIVHMSSSKHAARARKMILDLVEQIEADGEVMLNQDGTPAKFGHLKPSVTTAPIRISALACLYLLADHMLGSGTKYGKRYDEILKNHKGALTHPETHFLWIHPWYQDIIAYVVLGIQYDLADSPYRSKLFWDALMKMWSKTKHEGNTFYAWFLLFLNDGWKNQYAFSSGLKTLREFNLSGEQRSCKDPGPVKNSDTYHGEKKHWGFGKKKRYVSTQCIPTWRRVPADIVWQRDPFTLDGHGDHYHNYMDFLLAYYLGRRCGFRLPY